MHSAQTLPVVVLGAGPVGLTIAAELRRHGVDVRVFDKAPGIREVSKALILHVRTQEILAQVGVMPAIRAEARPLTEVVVHAYGKHVGSWDFDRIDGPFPHPLIIGQNRTQHRLLERLEELGGAVAWNAEATSVRFGPDDVEVTIARAGADADVLRCAYVVGAEGSNSLVRKTLGFTFEGERYSGEQFVQADCEIRWAMPSGRSYLFLTADGYMMMIEMPDGRVRIFISLPDADGAGAAEAARQLGAVEATSDQPTLDEIQRHFVRLSGFDCTLSNPVWLARYRTSHRYANAFARGRGFIAGDAAHVHVPIGGQGMNTGIQDGFNLAWKLAGVMNGDYRADILDSYQAERHPVAKGLIEGTDFAYRGILRPGELRQKATRLIGPFLLRSERVQTFVRETLEELRIAYPHSPLNVDLGGAAGPAPGERAPDAILVRASDLVSVRLSEVTQGSGWNALVFSGLGGADGGRPALEALRGRFGARLGVYSVVADARSLTASASGAEVLLDPLHELHTRYGVSEPAIYVLRPDTFVGARSPADSCQNLIDRLGNVLQTEGN